MSDQAIINQPTPVAPSSQEIDGHQTETEVAKEKVDSQQKSREVTIGVHNQTPDRLTIKLMNDQDRNSEITFAPLEDRWFSISQEYLLGFKQLNLRGLILLEHKDQPLESVRPSEKNNDSSGYLGLLVFLFILYIIAGGWVNENFQDYRLWYWIGVPVTIIGTPIVILILNYLSNKFGWTTIIRVTNQSLRSCLNILEM